jgi:hypothetical protein
VTRRRPWLARAPGRRSRPPKRRGRAFANGLGCATSGCGETTEPRRQDHAAAPLDAPCWRPNGEGSRWRKRDVTAAAAGGEVFDSDDRATTAGMAPADGGRADLRASGAGCAPLPLRSHRRRPRERDRPARSTVRIALAKPDDVGLIRRRTGWRGGPVPARPTARPWPPSRATPNRPTGEPATPLPRGCGPAGSTALCSTYAPNLTPRLDSTNSVLRRGPGPGSEISPDGARHRAEVQSTQLKRRQPALTRLVGARCRVHACCLDWPVTSGVEERVRPAASWLTIQAVGRWLDWLSLCRSSPVGDVPA